MQLGKQLLLHLTGTITQIYISSVDNFEILWSLGLWSCRLMCCRLLVSQPIPGHIASQVGQIAAHTSQTATNESR